MIVYVPGVFNFIVLIPPTPLVNVAVPRTRLPAVNVTVPVGPPGAPEVTVAVSTTGSKVRDGLGKDVTLVCEGYRLTVSVSDLLAGR